MLGKQLRIGYESACALFDLPDVTFEGMERQEPLVNQVLGDYSLAMLARLYRYGRFLYHGGSKRRYRTRNVLSDHSSV